VVDSLSNYQLERRDQPAIGAGDNQPARGKGIHQVRSQRLARLVGSHRVFEQQHPRRIRRRLPLPPGVPVLERPPQEAELRIPQLCDFGYVILRQPDLAQARSEPAQRLGGNQRQPGNIWQCTSGHPWDHSRSSLLDSLGVSAYAFL